MQNSKKASLWLIQPLRKNYEMFDNKLHAPVIDFKSVLLESLRFVSSHFKHFGKHSKQRIA